MKPSVILYKALPDDLLQRLQEHFTVHQVANLSPQTVEQNAAIFAEAEGLLGSNENVDAALLEKMPKLRATSTISVGYDNFDVDALTARERRNSRCRAGCLRTRATVRRFAVALNGQRRRSTAYWICHP